VNLFRSPGWGGEIAAVSNLRQHFGFWISLPEGSGHQNQCIRKKLKKVAEKSWFFSLDSGEQTGIWKVETKTAVQ